MVVLSSSPILFFLTCQVWQQEKNSLMHLLGLTVSFPQRRRQLTQVVSLSLPPPLHLNLLHAKRNYLYRQSKCHSTERLCKHCQWSGTPPSLVLSRPTWNVSNHSTWKASLLETVFLIGVMINAFVPEIQEATQIAFVQDTALKDTMEMTPPDRQGRDLQTNISFLTINLPGSSIMWFPPPYRKRTAQSFYPMYRYTFCLEKWGEKSAFTKNISQLLLRWIWPLTQEGSQFFHFCERCETGRSCCKFK